MIMSMPTAKMTPFPNSDQQGPGGQGLSSPRDPRLCRAGPPLHFISHIEKIMRKFLPLTQFHLSVLHWIFLFCWWKIEGGCCERHIFPFLLHLCRELQTAPFWGHTGSLFQRQKSFTTQTFFSFSFSISELLFHWALLSTKFAVQRFCKIKSKNFCHFVASSRKG